MVILSELKDNKRLLTLDGLRGVAVLFVFFSHTSGRDMYIFDNLRLHGIGHIGVYLFFVLSSFLLTGPLLKKELTYKSIFSFFIKRFLRIIPLYYLIISVVFVFEIISGTYTEKYLHIGSFESLLMHYVFYSGNGVFWSIVIEMQFYLVVPLIALGLKKIPLISMLLLLGFSAINFLLYVAKNIEWPFYVDYIEMISPNDRLNGTYIDVFSFGIIGAYLLHVYPEYLRKNRRSLAAIANTLFFSLCLLTLALVGNKFLWFNQPNYNFRYLSSLYGFVFSLYLISLVVGNKYGKIMEVKILRFVGIIGFSFYLVHFGVFRIINNYEIYPQIKFVLAFVITSLVSLVLYKTVELTSINFAKKIINKIHKV